MSAIQDQECPLCEGAAKFEFTDYKNRKHFLCDRCTEFQISLGAEKRLTGSPAEWRTQLSELARRAKEDHVLVITLPTGPKQEGAANPALVHEYVRRSKLPQ